MNTFKLIDFGQPYFILVTSDNLMIAKAMQCIQELRTEQANTHLTGRKSKRFTTSIRILDPQCVHFSFS